MVWRRQHTISRSGTPAGRLASLTPTITLYGAAWLASVIGLLAFQAARLELGTPIPFLLIITLGTLLSAWLSQRSLRENTRLLFGFLDAMLALYTITAQPSLNALVNITTDPSIEIYFSTSLLWYFTLRTPLMVSPASVLFQCVPIMALFGLVGSYLFAPAVPYLFLAFVVVVLLMLITARQMELQVWLPLALVVRSVLLGGLAATILASGMAFLLWLAVGELVSGMVIGLPFRTPATNSNALVIPALQVGAGPITPSKIEIMRVRFLHGDARYLRMDAYDLYTGRGWNRVRMDFRRIEADERGEFVIFSELPNYLRSRQVHAEITIVGGFHQQLYAPGVPLWLKLHERRRAIGFVRNTGALWLRMPLSPGARYEVRALVVPDDPATLRSRTASTLFWGAWSESPRNPRVYELVRRLTAHQPTDYDKVLALKHYIETHAVYNTETEMYPPDEDVVEYFLFEARQGYCVEFATALAVMCQYAGLPARVASGYLLKERDPQTGDYIVRDEHRHLWTEVYFEGLGWVPFDATENAPVIEAGDTASGHAGSNSAHMHSLLRWRYLLDGLILVSVLYLLWVLVLANRSGIRRSAALRASRLYTRLVYTLRLIGCPAPAPYQSPESYLRTCIAILSHNGREATTALLHALQEPLSRLFYAPLAEPVQVETEVEGKIKALQRQVQQEIGTLRLIMRAIALRWSDWLTGSHPSEHSERYEHGGQVR